MLEITLRVAAEGEVQVEWRRELARVGEEVPRGVGRGCGLEHEVGQGGVEGVARDQRGGRRNQRQIAGRPVVGEIHGAPREAHGFEEPEAARVCVSAGEAERHDAAVGEQALDDFRIYRSHCHHRVHAAGEQRLHRVGAAKRQQAERLPADSVGREQSERKLMRAAAFKADGDALVFEVAKSGRGRSFAQQDPQRLKADGAQSDEAGRPGAIGHAALDEGDIHAGYGIPEQAQILDAARGFEHFHAHSALLQEFRVAQRKGIVAAPSGAGGKPEGFGRRRPDKLPGHEEARRGDDEGKAIDRPE